MIKQPFYGVLSVEDKNIGNHNLYAIFGEDDFGKLRIELHNGNPTEGLATRIGSYGKDWTLKRVKWGPLVYVYEMTVLKETPPVKVRCVTGHKFGKMLEGAIEIFNQNENEI
jgi:hypothetical protein